MIANLRTGIRSLARTPGFTVTAILTLALGIGLSTAVFTVADALLLRRLPIRDQDRLVVLWGERRGFANYPLGLEDAREFARRATTLDGVALFGFEAATPKVIRYQGQVSQLKRALVSGNFFQVLGARPFLGRELTDTDDAQGAAPAMVLSYGAWQRQFGDDRDVIGRQVITHDDGIAYTVVGVMPRGLEYPAGTDFWAPIIPSQYAAFDLIGRLAPGAAPGLARDELSAFFQRPEGHADDRQVRGVVHSLPQLILGDVRPALLVFAAASALLLLIACVNVANLLVVRGLARVREIAVRSALGAGRWQIVAQLLTENAVLAVAGGLLGLAVAGRAVRTFVAFAPAGLPRLDEIELNGMALGGAMAITTLATLLFALAPAALTTRVELQQTLRSGARHSASRRSRLFAEGLVAAQVALALLVLSAAGLITRSLIKLERARLAFNPSQLLMGELALPLAEYDNVGKQVALLQRLTTQLRSVPGVQSISPVVAMPFSHGWDGRPAAEGQSTDQANANPMIDLQVVGSDYFATFGIPVLQGRQFTDADRTDAPRVAIVSEATAQYYWPGVDPIGKRLFLGDEHDPAVTIVGVVPDTRYRDLRDARPSVYFPMLQSLFPFAPLTLAIRTTVPPAELITTLRVAVAEAAPGVVLSGGAPFENLLQGPLAQPRLNAVLLLIFAGAAVLLAAVGLFGVMATMVRQRTRDIGVRMALGANAGDVWRMVMWRGTAIAGLGLVAGTLAALGTNYLLQAILYQVSPTDAVTLLAVGGLLLSVAMLASVIPARSSTRIDPVIALKADG